MTTVSDDRTRRKPLRLWPGVVIVILTWLIRFALPVIEPEATPIGVLGGLVGGFAIVLWWVFFSRAPWLERLGAIVLMAGSLFAARRFVHESIATGAEGVLFAVLAVPVLSLAFVVWAVATRGLANGVRRATMAATIVLACGVWTLVRTGGFTGSFDNDLHWRWAKTPEERLLASAADERPPLASPPASAKTPQPGSPAEPVTDTPRGRPTPGSAPAAPGTSSKRPEVKSSDEPVAGVPAAADAARRAEWPGFRGPGRDGIVRGVRINTDWTSTPPVQLWRRAIGPGWSSFAVRGDLLYTQEQRGDDEIVACYKVSTGELVWRHRDAARFWESNAGAGPRGTPTLANGRVYTLGATGIVNALDARDGAVVWSRNAASDTGATLPEWGFAGSPLVLDDIVVVAASGALVAYEAATGKPRWFGPKGGDSYTSPQLVTIDGVRQILLVSGSGVTAVAPADGAQLWEHAWRGYPIVQPALTADGNVLIAITESSGTRRIAVTRGPGGWRVEERWTSKGLKPYFNDFVVHEGHAFGFDGGILACIDLADGRRTWKGGRYGHGQLVLLPDQDVLLVLSEEGELALVKATSDQFTELARLPGIEGKTWNHPVLVGDVLLARNSQEMAAFRLPLAGR